MDIIDGVLSEKEFRYFNKETYEALGMVLNDVLACILLDYVNKPNADVKIKSDIMQYIGNKINRLSFAHVAKERGIIDLVQSIVLETLPSNEDKNRIIEDLRFLEENYDKVTMTVPLRKKEQYDFFYGEIKSVLNRMIADGEQPTYSNCIERLDSNRFLFYNPHEKTRNSGAAVLINKAHMWRTALRGCEFLVYANEHNIDYNKRRLF